MKYLPIMADGSIVTWGRPDSGGDSSEIKGATASSKLCICWPISRDLLAVQLGVRAQKALLLMPRTAKGASTSSNELNAQVSLPTDDNSMRFRIKINSKSTEYCPRMTMIEKDY